MTDERQLAVTYLGLALACAVMNADVTVLSMVAVALLALLIGYRRKVGASAAVAGFSLYYPLALLLGMYIPLAWGFVAAAGVLIVLSERLSFEYYISAALKASPAVDGESRMQTEFLSRSHWRKLGWFSISAGVVSAASMLAYQFTPYASVLAGASVLLFFALWGYARR